MSKGKGSWSYFMFWDKLYTKVQLEEFGKFTIDSENDENDFFFVKQIVSIYFKQVYKAIDELPRVTRRKILGKQGCCNEKMRPAFCKLQNQSTLIKYISLVQCFALYLVRCHKNKMYLKTG